MRAPVIAGNWKMNLDRAGAVALARALRERFAGRAEVEVGVAPAATCLAAVHEALAGAPIFLAGQNLHPEPFGAFTGEISGEMLKDVGCTHVIVGHSERRRLLGESNAFVGEKVKSALKQELRPILCVGETLAERRAGRTREVVLAQLDDGLKGVAAAQVEPLLLAYEPVWAIGTGVNATPEQAGEVHLLIRDWLASRFGAKQADATRILYGGSVKPENAAALLAVEDVDGALVGGASLQAASFVAIVDACPQRAERLRQAR